MDLVVSKHFWIVSKFWLGFCSSSSMKKIYFFIIVLLLVGQSNFAQQLTLRKGRIIDTLAVNDSIPETFSLFLPTAFETAKKWPVLFVFDLEGNSQQALSGFIGAAEDEGFIAASSNSINDSISLSKNMQVTGRMVNKVVNMLPIDGSRVYVAGFSKGARFANLVPLFLKNVDGVVSIGASIQNTELLNSKNPFHFVGIVGREDFNYTELLEVEKTLNKLKFENQLILFDGGNEWPSKSEIRRALRFLKLSDMAKGTVEKDSSYVEEAYRSELRAIEELISRNKMLLAEQYMGELQSVFRVHTNVDSLREERKRLRKGKAYRSQRRAENAAFFQESLLREDYDYYLEEDILTYNFNNLGWWNYQMSELEKLVNGSDRFKQQMGKRLKSYINALIEDYIDNVKADQRVDQEALIFLSMLKTITEPQNYDHYLTVISISSQNEDYGTALFYLEELLKKGFKDKKRLYDLEHTALFRISPEFNALVEKYLDDARYEIIEE